MAFEFLTIQGANLFCDDDPDESNHIQLDEIALPNLVRTMEDHTPGGGFATLQVDMDMYEAFVVPFKFVGISISMLRRAGLNSGKKRKYTIFKEIKDQRTKERRRLTCVVNAQLGSAEQEAYNKRGLTGFNYELQAVDTYDLTIGDQNIYSFDLFSNRRIVGTEDENRETNTILGIG